jgi:RimJ/RimL family protein N-acetyltransferase
LEHRSAPTLETERLILRHWRKDDFRPYQAIVGDAEVMRHFAGTLTAEECWRRLSASVGSWSLLGFGGWAVVRKSDDKLVGMVALFNSWRDFEPEFAEDPEMGWIFSTEVHGQGIAGEACRAVLDWADSTFAPETVWAIIAPANEPSFKLAERLGFERVCDTLYNEEPTAVLKRLRATS